MTYSLNHNYFHDIDRPDKAYWLGWLWADGCVRKLKNANSFSVELCIRETDLPILEQFKVSIHAGNPIHHDTNRRVVKLYLTSKEMFDDLVLYGIIPNKSLLATEPMGIPDELVRHFVRGVFEGDGCITVANKFPQISILGTKGLCDWVFNNIQTQLLFDGKIRETKFNNWEYRISRKCNIELLGKWMYNDVKPEYILERKYLKFCHWFGDKFQDTHIGENK